MNIACRRLALITIPLLLVACGGGSVGGTVNGLADGDSVTLQNNGKDDLTVTKNGVFEFEDLVLEEGSYVVTVSKQPASATCAVTNGSGVIDVNGTAIEDVVVTCTATDTIMGTLTGFVEGVVLQLTNTDGNGVTETLDVTRNGAFAFDGIRPAGDRYNVTITSPQVVQACTVTNGNGTVVAGQQTAIRIACN
jgi:hypothetical protein